MTADIDALRPLVERYKTATAGGQWHLALEIAEKATVLLTKLDELTAIADAARYEYGARPCMEGDCDHAYEADDNAPDDSACPLIETRHATAAELLAVELLLTSTDGDLLDDAEEIPVGEIRRALGEAREQASAVTA
ncbi:hypothetical protein AB0K35_28345 [Micromonospora sp. NPDC053740]|uniref:hypothetical protein n=1 Tax=Micromonospora sp. NPDC053740 TaxID=3155173 RepID=UPI00342BD007